MYDLVVLGGGSAGLRVAQAAARLGARVALVERAARGGQCASSAAVASKALVAAAHVAHVVRGAGRFGIRTALPAIDFPAVMARARAVAAEAAQGGSDESLRDQGIQVVHGTPAFEAYDTVVVDGTTRLNAQRFVIATGSRPAIPPIAGLAEAGALDSSAIWSLDALPPELVVLGAGATGIELAQAFARLGSKVIVLSDMGAILPREDPEVSARVQAVLAAEGIGVRTNVEITQVGLRNGQKVCSVRDRSTGATSEVAGTHLLVAAGRLANVEGLHLENVGVHASPEHGIEVDEYLQTRSTRILAIGDVVQGQPFTHAAERQAALAVQTAVLRMPRKIDYAAMPWVTYTDPEVATVGLTEAEANRQHAEVRVLRCELCEADRSRIEGCTDGFAKVVANPAGKILGATVVGPEAALVLQEVVLAMEHGVTLQNIADTFHTYPTYAGLIHRLACEFVAGRVETSLVHKAIRWYFGFQPRTAPGDEPATTAAASSEHTQPVGHTVGHDH
jgi:pyruvate/2-oxoglutarate dehydrogenase complex dihydrolipoamide dehydrogenase (E3) component